MGYCVICGALSQPAASLAIGGHLICSGCERAITVIEPADPAYDFYSSGLKRIWRLV